MSKSERINILKKNNICRSCLSLGVHTPSHPAEVCDYLVQKRLLFLKCPGNECKLRSTLCDKQACHPRKYPTDRVLCVPQAQQCIVDTENGNKRETLAVSCDDRAPSAAHYDAEPKSAVVNKPADILKNAKEEVEDTPEKSSKNEEMSNRKSNISKERHYSSLSLCTSLVQTLRMLIFIFCYLVSSFKKIKKDFYKSEKIPKRQISETRGLKIFDSQISRSEFDPG